MAGGRKVPVVIQVSAIWEQELAEEWKQNSVGNCMTIRLFVCLFQIFNLNSLYLAWSVLLFSEVEFSDSALCSVVTASAHSIAYPP